MKFTGTIKRLTRKSTISNDTEFELVIVTDYNLRELCDIRADDLVEVNIEKEK